MLLYDGVAELPEGTEPGYEIDETNELSGGATYPVEEPIGLSEVGEPE